MIVLRAAWVVPVDQPPIRDGWVAIDRDRIVSVGRGNPSGLPSTELVRDCGRVALLPGLVNAHTHLELSWLRGRVPPAASFTGWIGQLFAARGATVERRDDEPVTAAVSQAIREARETGTAAFGDISNSLASVQPLIESGLAALVFHELLGFKETDDRLVERTRADRAAVGGSSRVRVSLAPHAPYSVSRELFVGIRRELMASPGAISSVHVGESAEEIELLEHGTGGWVRLLKLIGAWREDWTPPRTGPVEYLDSLGVFDTPTLAVHGVQLSEESLGRLRDRGATLVTCPRSNQWVGVGVPPVERFYRSGVPVAVGTDSLASVEDLNLFEELKALRWLAPGVPARRLLESATLTGATALGLSHELGSLTPGKRAEILAVAVPDGLQDVEEHLCSDVTPSAISWADSEPPRDAAEGLRAGTMAPAAPGRDPRA